MPLWKTQAVIWAISSSVPFSLQAYQSSDWIGSWTLFIFGRPLLGRLLLGYLLPRLVVVVPFVESVLGVMLVPTLFTFFLVLGIW